MICGSQLFKNKGQILQVRNVEIPPILEVFDRPGIIHSDKCFQVKTCIFQEFFSDFIKLFFFRNGVVCITPENPGHYCPQQHAQFLNFP